jgi:hypothetical protein
MARMAEAVVEGRGGPAQIRAFRSLGEAEAWLGTSPTAGPELLMSANLRTPKH